jgi:2-polyprenyl-6-hydroxyphenyl methylase/3-demethylubiquinone-9 3-methyltransferase
MTGDYYADKLSADRLQQVYETAPPRIRQYLLAEQDHVLGKIRPGNYVLELGCGYGRILAPLAQKVRWIVGIDISMASLIAGREKLKDFANCRLLQMDAIQLAFHEDVFDVVICIQNGISAFHRNQQELIAESIRVTRPGGIVLFSSYSDKFWEDRLLWFQQQSHQGLLGEINLEKSHNGEIVCKDGFTATTVGAEKFMELTDSFDVTARIDEVDESSLFCEIAV